MTENEILNYMELGNLVVKIEAQAYNIEKGDLHCQLIFLDHYPFYDIGGALELRNNALKEYYGMLIDAFIRSCRLLAEMSDVSTLKAVDKCVNHLVTIIDSRGFDVQMLPMAMPLSDLFRLAYDKLLTAGQSEYVLHLDGLKQRIFM